MNNIITASFGQLRKTTTRKIYQYDYGMILVFAGLSLPEHYEVHFCNEGDERTQTVDGDAQGVYIPFELTNSGKNIKAYVYIHTGADDGETIAEVTIPVEKRPRIDGTVPLPDDPYKPIDM